MKPEFSNISSGIAFRRTLIWCPIILSCLALGGVPFQPLHQLRKAEGELSQALENLEERDSLASQLDDFEETSDLTVIREGVRSLQSLTPNSLTAIEINSVIRYLASIASVDIQSLTISDPKNLGFDAFSYGTAMREIELAATAKISNLLFLLDSIREFGYPAAVLGMTMSRKQAVDRKFTIMLKLGFFQKGPTSMPTAQIVDNF